MKKSPFLTLRLILIICVITSLYSCQETSQLYVTKPVSNLKAEGRNYVFENDTVRIIYNFWGEKGKLSFNIYNKLDIPLFIDWKKSSFIRNGNKIDYWNDIETTQSSGSYSGATISGNYVYLPTGKRYTLSSSAGQAYVTEIKTKPERITFIAPHSAYAYNKSPFTLIDNYISDRDINKWDYESQKKTYDSTEIIRIYYKQFSINDAPLTFRNFLTLSTSEKTEHEFYIDNGFYLSMVYEMEKLNFLGRNMGGTIDTYQYPWQDGKKFYRLKIPDEKQY